MKLNNNFIAIIMAVALLSCNKGDQSKLNPNEISTQDVMLSELPLTKMKGLTAPPFAAADSTSNFQLEKNLQAGQPAPQIDWDKKIIKTANVTLELNDYQPYNQTIHSSTKRYGAYIASEQQSEKFGKLENRLSIKVPVDQFEPMMNALPAEGVKVVEKNITTEDVTGEVVDTKARTEAKKQVRDRYLDLLKQAKNMKDILEVQNEINSIQEDIEAGTGRVNYLVHQAAYSTINLTYYQFLPGSKTPDDDPSFFEKVTAAFANGFSIITGFILLMVTFWPFVIAGALAWVVFRKYRVFKSAKA